MKPARASERHGNRAGALAAVAVLVVATFLAIYKTRIAVHVGPGWDTFAFLSNAAEFAGRGYGYAELHRPPFMSLITALAWRAGVPIHESTIQWVDAVLSVSGILAFYLIARRRFSPALSAVGAVGLLAFQPLWQYFGVGYTDLPSIALSMWTLLAVIAATEKNLWWYGVAALLFLAAVLTRYTALLAIFPALLWLAFRGRIFRHAKAIAWAAFIAVLAYLPAWRFYTDRFGDGLFPFVLAFGVSEAVTAPGGEGAVAAAGPWYLSKLPAFLSADSVPVIAWAVLAVAAVGLGVAAWSAIAERRPSTKRLLVALAGAGVILLGQNGGLALRQLTIPFGVYLIWRTLGDREPRPDNRLVPVLALDAVMLSWLLTYFDFHGNQSIQVPRYIIPMAPGIMYLLLLGWHSAATDVARTITGGQDGGRDFDWLARYAAPIALGVLLGGTILSSAYHTPTVPDRYVKAARITAEGMRDNEHWTPGMTVYSDLWPQTAWYLRGPARPMPFFKDDRAFAHELAKENADYFVTLRSRRFDDFAEVDRSDSLAVLRRVENSELDLPRVAYLGKAWDNYLETVTDFDFFLMGDSGRYGWEGTAFLDSMPPETLPEYAAVAAFGLRWRDRAQGEKNLRDYLESGGSLVIDASRNLGELPYELGDTVMFDTVMRRGSLPKDAQITVDSEFAAKHPEIGTITKTPFVNETGGGWFGAEYSALPGSPELEVLAWSGGKPVIAVRQVGKGRVYWIGYNLVWHAFLTENASERRLVRAVFDDAIASAKAAGAGTGESK